MTVIPEGQRANAPLGLLIILGALIAVAPMSIDMYLPALPQITHDLGAAEGSGELTVAAFFVGLALGQLFYGPLSDRIGRRIPILVGSALYVGAGIGCALATTMESLIVLRFLQALGGCAGIVVARAVVRDRFEHQEMARIFSLLMLIMGLAPILAPLIGGLLLQVASWREIFWSLVLFGVLLAAAVFFRLPESRSQGVADRARIEGPLGTYALVLRNPAVMGYILTGALATSALFAYIAASASLLIGTYGVRPQDFGWIFGLNAAGLIAASQINRLLLRRWSADAILTGALQAAVAGAVVLTVVAFTGFGGLIGLLVPLFFCISIQGLIGINATAGALAMEPMRAGTVSGLVGSSQFGFGAIMAGLVGLFADGTPRPLAVGVLLAFAVALAGMRFLVAPARRAVLAQDG